MDTACFEDREELRLLLESPPWKPISVLSLSGQLMQPLRSVLSAPTLVTGVGELVAEMRAGDTGKAEGGGRQQAGGGGGGGGGGRRRGAAAAAAGRPQSLISQSDLRVTPAHNAIQQHHQLFQHEPRFSSFHFTTEPQTIFPAHFTEQLFWARPVSGLKAYCGRGKVVWSVPTDARQPVLSDSLTFGPLILSKLGILVKITENMKYDKI